CAPPTGREWVAMLARHACLRCRRRGTIHRPSAEADMAGFLHPEFLIETDALASEFGDPRLCILDCTVHLIPNPDIGYTVKPGREDFEKGHIPGARFVDLQADLSAPHPKLRFMLPSAE